MEQKTVYFRETPCIPPSLTVSSDAFFPLLLPLSCKFLLAKVLSTTYLDRFVNSNAKQTKREKKPGMNRSERGYIRTQVEQQELESELQALDGLTRTRQTSAAEAREWLKQTQGMMTNNIRQHFGWSFDEKRKHILYSGPLSTLEQIRLLSSLNDGHCFATR